MNLQSNSVKRIAIVGGGPSALFAYKRIIDSEKVNIEISIFEKKKHLGFGMPYSSEGANDEHVTNVSDNEIPTLVTSVGEWITTLPSEIITRFSIDTENFNEYKVLPRILFGMYLKAQFDLLKKIALAKGYKTIIHLETTIIDVKENTSTNQIDIVSETKNFKDFDFVILCMGHNWPKKYEDKISGYFDSPYPPNKLKIKLNHPVAIKGSSLTAIDAIRTISRSNGTFKIQDNGKLKYIPSLECPDFKIVMHSRSGMLPAVRFHLSDSHLRNNSLLSNEEIDTHIKQNDGFLSLDYLFEYNFKYQFIDIDPAFYERIRNFSIEEFVDDMMTLREEVNPFQLLEAEYVQAERSIRNKDSIYWKEMLGVLSFAMNYPAKHLCAEDMIRLQDKLLPLISIVIAYVPQSSCEELLALHKTGILDIITVGEESYASANRDGGANYYYNNENGVKTNNYFKTFIDCVGQPHLSYSDFPFKSLSESKTISRALIRFKFPENAEILTGDENYKIEKVDDKNYYLQVSGIAINDNFQVLNSVGAFNSKIYIMAVPYIGGYNPDYSGLDFCEAASLKIINAIMKYL